MLSLAATQQWTYRAPQGFEQSRLVIGALLTFEDRPSIVCCSVSGAPRRNPDGSVEAVTIPFLPLAEQAFRASIIAADGTAPPPDAFFEALEQWADDPRGLSTFTVTFDGYLDRLIARQMAAIIGRDAA